MRNYYDLLQVQRDAKDVVIRASYEALLQTYHPDKLEDRRRGHRIAKLLAEAYTTLNDPTIRAEYDRELEMVERGVFAW